MVNVSVDVCSVGAREHSFWCDYSIDADSKLGAGVFGVVRRGVHLATGQACATKCVDFGTEHLTSPRGATACERLQNAWLRNGCREVTRGAGVV